MPAQERQSGTACFMCRGLRIPERLFWPGYIHFWTYMLRWRMSGNMNITRAPRLHMVVIYLLVWLELENVKQVLQEGHSFIFYHCQCYC